MRVFRRHADDDLANVDASVTGFSAMRPETLFPTSPTPSDVDQTDDAGNVIDEEEEEEKEI
jgi:hypothetical protein